ncbi:NAD(P)-binding domain-containing protein [bacterium]|jgi:NosR/NirI family transcriptional regulator, nitrous oxide reductase regulator|nr:NAD(P)-binding domain-containing protein [bacterium]
MNKVRSGVTLSALRRLQQYPRLLFGKKNLSPSYPEKPVVDDNFESNVKDLYIIGDVSGTPLIKMTMNQGFDLANLLHREIQSKGQTLDPDAYEVLVIGAGCAGLGALRQLQKLGIRSLCIESNRSLHPIRNFTRGKPIYLEPLDLEFKDDWGLTEGTRETVLEQTQTVIESEGLPIHEFEKVTGVERKGSLFEIKSDKGSYKARYVVLSIGKSGNPRKAGVPGELENPQKIFHRLIDPADHVEQDILIYGGGDVALEAAIALCANNRVTLATIDKEFIFPKKRNVDQLMSLAEQGRLSVHLDTKLLAVGEKEVGISVANGESTKLKNDAVFEMIGAELPLPFLKKLGLRLQSDWTVLRKVAMLVCFIGIYLLYGWKKGFWPFSYAQGISQLPGILSHPSFWYSALYTFLMAFFGMKAMKRWNRGGKDTYQTFRFLSLITFQILSFVGIEIILAILTPKYWWRFYGINNPFPLLFDTFFNWSASDPSLVKWSLIGACFTVTFVIIPIAVRYHGKRFCTWICGCGGLAETFGDRWRHLSHKGVRAEKWEIVGDILMFWVFTSALVILILYGGNTASAGWWHQGYALLADFWMIAVIPVALYPFFGGKVWCRFWCPLAKYMQVLSRWYGTLQISSNEKCISCTQCSSFCEVGVDVMNFAKNQQSFDNRNSSCIHCGICISVCPMDVLSFNNDARNEK